jgi:PAS domain S-box-containing protein
MGFDGYVKMKEDVLKQSPTGEVILDMATEASGKSEERYRTILEEMKEGYWEIDLAGNLTFFNDAICRLLGYPKKELLGTNYRAFTSTEDADKIYKAFNRVYRTGKPTKNMFFRLGLKDGSKRFAETSVFPRRNNKGEIIGFRGASRDVTERKQAEEALLASEAHYRELAGSITDVFFQIDRNLCYTYWNKASEMLTGIPARDAIGKSIYEVFADTPETRKAAKVYLDVIKSRQSRTFENPYRIAGKDYLFEISAYPSSQGASVFVKDVTERKKAEQTLQTERNKLQSLIGAMEDGLTIRDTDYNLIYQNEPSMLTSGGDHVGEKCYRALEGSEKVCDGCPAEKAFRDGKTHTSERRVIRPSGEVIFWENTASPVRDAEGRIVACLEIGRNITERKRTEEALAKSEERYRTVLDEMEESYYEVDIAGNFTFFNDAMCCQLGYSREELMGTSYRAITPSDNVEKVFGLYNQVYRTGEPFASIPMERITKDGKRLLTESSIFPLRNESGEIIGFRGIARDVSERAQMIEALKQSEEKYRTILEDMEDSYFEVDLAGNLTFANDSTLRHLKYSRKELIGLNYKDFTAAEDAETVYKAFNKVYRTGKPVHGLIWKIVRKGIGEGFAEATILPLRNERREIVGFRGVGRDITERKKTEEERKQLEQKAQLASRLACVGELASGVAHEINNPLTGVIGYAHLLLDRRDISQDIRHDLKIINEGAQRVAGIVRKLLTFAGQQKPEQKLTDINEIISTTLDLRAYELASNNIKVTFQPAHDLPMTIVDPGQLQQVFLNIIINAETEMKLAHGKGKLSIKTEQTDNAIHISFKDDGPGIAKENLERIFNPFFTTREVGQGTGLGLNLCHGIITEHKGRIWAESKLGRGATFFVELPIVTKGRQSALLKPPAKEPEKVAKAKILVVDDEPLVRQLASRVLSEEGHEVETVDNAEDALKRIKNTRYNRILLDIKMPGMSGINLYEQLKEIAPSLKKRVVFVTGDVMGKRTTDFLSKTKAPYIAKPFDAERLKTEINRILARG